MFGGKGRQKVNGSKGRREVDTPHNERTCMLSRKQKKTLAIIQRREKESARKR